MFSIMNNNYGEGPGGTQAAQPWQQPRVSDEPPRNMELPLISLPSSNEEQQNRQNVGSGPVSFRAPQAQVFDARAPQGMSQQQAKPAGQPVMPSAQHPTAHILKAAVQGHMHDRPPGQFKEPHPLLNKANGVPVKVLITNVKGNKSCYALWINPNDLVSNKKTLPLFLVTNERYKPVEPQEIVGGQKLALSVGITKDEWWTCFRTASAWKSPNGISFPRGESMTKIFLAFDAEVPVLVPFARSAAEDGLDDPQARRPQRNGVRQHRALELLEQGNIPLVEKRRKSRPEFDDNTPADLPPLSSSVLMGRQSGPTTGGDEDGNPRPLMNAHDRENGLQQDSSRPAEQGTGAETARNVATDVQGEGGAQMLDAQQQILRKTCVEKPAPLKGQGQKIQVVRATAMENQPELQAMASTLHGALNQRASLLAYRGAVRVMAQAPPPMKDLYALWVNPKESIADVRLSPMFLACNDDRFIADMSRKPVRGSALLKQAGIPMIKGWSQIICLAQELPGKDTYNYAVGTPLIKVFLPTPARVQVPNEMQMREMVLGQANSLQLLELVAKGIVSASHLGAGHTNGSVTNTIGPHGFGSFMPAVQQQLPSGRAAIAAAAEPAGPVETDRPQVEDDSIQDGDEINIDHARVDVLVDQLTGVTNAAGVEPNPNHQGPGTEPGATQRDAVAAEQPVAATGRQAGADQSQSTTNGANATATEAVAAVADANAAAATIIQDTTTTRMQLTGQSAALVNQSAERIQEWVNLMNSVKAANLGITAVPVDASKDQQSSKGKAADALKQAVAEGTPEVGSNAVEGTIRNEPEQDQHEADQPNIELADDASERHGSDNEQEPGSTPNTDPKPLRKKGKRELASLLGSDPNKDVKETRSTALHRTRNGKETAISGGLDFNRLRRDMQSKKDAAPGSGDETVRKRRRRENTDDKTPSKSLTGSPITLINPSATVPAMPPVAVTATVATCPALKAFAPGLEAAAALFKQVPAPAAGTAVAVTATASKPQVPATEAVAATKPPTIVVADPAVTAAAASKPQALAADTAPVITAAATKPLQAPVAETAPTAVVTAAASKSQASGGQATAVVAPQPQQAATGEAVTAAAAAAQAPAAEKAAGPMTPTQSQAIATAAPAAVATSALSQQAATSVSSQLTATAVPAAAAAATSKPSQPTTTAVPAIALTTSIPPQTIVTAVPAAAAATAAATAPSLSSAPSAIPTDVTAVVTPSNNGVVPMNASAGMLPVLPDTSASQHAKTSTVVQAQAAGSPAATAPPPPPVPKQGPQVLTAIPSTAAGPGNPNARNPFSNYYIPVSRQVDGKTVMNLVNGIMMVPVQPVQNVVAKTTTQFYAQAPQQLHQLPHTMPHRPPVATALPGMVMHSSSTGQHIHALPAQNMFLGGVQGQPPQLPFPRLPTFPGLLRQAMIEQVVPHRPNLVPQVTITEQPVENPTVSAPQQIVGKQPVNHQAASLQAQTAGKQSVSNAGALLPQQSMERQPMRGPTPPLPQQNIMAQPVLNSSAAGLPQTRINEQRVQAPSPALIQQAAQKQPVVLSQQALQKQNPSASLPQPTMTGQGVHSASPSVPQQANSKQPTGNPPASVPQLNPAVFRVQAPLLSASQQPNPKQPVANTLPAAPQQTVEKQSVQKSSAPAPQQNVTAKPVLTVPLALVSQASNTDRSVQNPIAVVNPEQTNEKRPETSAAQKATEKQPAQVTPLPAQPPPTSTQPPQPTEKQSEQTTPVSASQQTIKEQPVQNPPSTHGRQSPDRQPAVLPPLSTYQPSTAQQSNPPPADAEQQDRVPMSVIVQQSLMALQQRQGKPAHVAKPVCAYIKSRRDRNRKPFKVLWHNPEAVLRDALVNPVLTLCNENYEPDENQSVLHARHAKHMAGVKSSCNIKKLLKLGQDYTTPEGLIFTENTCLATMVKRYQMETQAQPSSTPAGMAGGPTDYTQGRTHHVSGSEDEDEDDDEEEEDEQQDMGRRASVDGNQHQMASAGVRQTAPTHTSGEDRVQTPGQPARHAVVTSVGRAFTQATSLMDVDNPTTQSGSKRHQPDSKQEDAGQRNKRHQPGTPSNVLNTGGQHPVAISQGASPNVQSAQQRDGLGSRTTSAGQLGGGNAIATTFALENAGNLQGARASPVRSTTRLEAVTSGHVSNPAVSDSGNRQQQPTTNPAPITLNGGNNQSVVTSSTAVATVSNDPPVLPNMVLAENEMALKSEMEVMSGLTALLKWLGCNYKVTRQLWQRYKQHYLPGGSQGMREFALAYMELCTAVESRDRDYITDVLTSEFKLTL